jgi:hypothetical protein
MSLPIPTYYIDIVTGKLLLGLGGAEAQPARAAPASSRQARRMVVNVKVL